jgi:hypothetical protein
VCLPCDVNWSGLRWQCRSSLKRVSTGSLSQRALLFLWCVCGTTKWLSDAIGPFEDIVKRALTTHIHTESRAELVRELTSTLDPVHISIVSSQHTVWSHPSNIENERSAHKAIRRNKRARTAIPPKLWLINLFTVCLCMYARLLFTLWDQQRAYSLLGRMFVLSHTQHDGKKVPFNSRGNFFNVCYFAVYCKFCSEGKFVSI